MTAPLRSRRRAATPVLVAALLASVPVAPATLAAQASDTLRLADLQQAAQQHDPRSAQTRLLAEQSALRLRTLQSERYPALVFNAQAQHQSDVTRVAFPGALQPYQDTYDAHVGARLRLLDPTLSARDATERAQSAEAERRVATSLYPQRQAVSDAFFTALLLAGQREVLDAAITDLEVQWRLASARVASGAALPSESTLLEAELLRRRQALDEVESARRVAWTLLADLTGRRLTGDEALETPDLTRAVETARSAIDSLRARPEFAQFARSRDVLSAREAAVTAQERPRIAAFGRTGYGRPGLNMLAREFDTYWLAGVQVEWSPFTWGSTRRDREVLALQSQVLATEERAFRERLERGTRSDVAAIDRLLRALASDDRIVALRERVLAETRLRLEEGVVTVGEYVDRETALQTARLARATHRVELAQARARFLTTVGLEVR